MHILSLVASWIRGREENSRRNYFIINLQESMGPGSNQTHDPWICSQTDICSHMLPTAPHGLVNMTFCTNTKMRSLQSVNTWNLTAPKISQLSTFIICWSSNQDSRYCKCSKISSPSCLPNWPSQTVQTQIRLLLKKQSDQGLPCLIFWPALCGFQPRQPVFYLRKEWSSSHFKLIFLFLNQTC